MEALLNAIPTRFSSVNISRHLSLKNFLKYNKGKQLTIYRSTETCSVTNHQEAQRVMASCHLLASDAAFSCHTAQKQMPFCISNHVKYWSM